MSSTNLTQVTISIDVPDRQQATLFYVQALGCQAVREQGDMTVLAAGQTELYLLQRAAGTAPLPDDSAVRTYQRHWSPVHLDFLVDDVDSVAADVERFGGCVEGRQQGDWGAIAYCADPFGHGFCLINEP